MANQWRNTHRYVILKSLEKEKVEKKIKLNF